MPKPAPRVVQFTDVRVSLVELALTPVECPGAPRVLASLDTYHILDGARVLAGGLAQRPYRHRIRQADPEWPSAALMDAATAAGLDALAAALTRAMRDAIPDVVLLGVDSAVRQTYDHLWLYSPVRIVPAVQANGTPDLAAFDITVYWNLLDQAGHPCYPIPQLDARPLGPAGWDLDLTSAGAVMERRRRAIRQEEGLSP